MSIASEISRIQQAKADIKTAIEAKGVTVPSSATIDTYDDYVSQISGGGGDDSVLINLIERDITSINIPNSVTSIGSGAFMACYNLRSIDIPDSVTSIGRQAFQGCSSLTSVTIGNSVTSIGNYAFQDCSSLTSVTIGNSVTSIGSSAFQNCYSLTSCTIGSGVTYIGGDIFYNCSSLTDITINATTPPEIDEETFEESNDCTIYVPSGSVNAYQNAENWSNYASRIQAIPNS